MCATPNTSSPSLTWGPSWTVVSCATRAFLGGYNLGVSKPIHRTADCVCHSEEWQLAVPLAIVLMSGNIPSSKAWCNEKLESELKGSEDSRQN
jgi:hypothetical protein